VIELAPHAPLAFALALTAAMTIGFTLGVRTAEARVDRLREQVADLEAALDFVTCPTSADFDARARRAEGAAPLPKALEPTR
jgi:hypothetical protein